MVDLDAAIGYVVAHGDVVDRARLAWLRSGIAPAPDVLDKVEMGATPDGGWPAFWGGDVASPAAPPPPPPAGPPPPGAAPPSTK